LELEGKIYSSEFRELTQFFKYKNFWLLNFGIWKKEYGRPKTKQGIYGIKGRQFTKFGILFILDFKIENNILFNGKHIHHF
jgi:hypothetical protein